MVSSDQVGIASSEWLCQEVLSVSGMHTFGRVFPGAVVPCRDMVVILGSVIVRPVEGGVRRAAAVIDLVIRRVGAGVRSACGL